MSKALSMIKKYCSDDLFDDEEEEENASFLILKYKPHLIYLLNSKSLY